MAVASLLALLDDIASVLDDVAVLTKAATKKTAGVLGDDLALNAQQVSGVAADRELPVVWAVAKGSFVNKAILVPAALLISAFLPWLVTPLLMIGGAYLCYEGFEKVAHRFWPHAHADPKAQLQAPLPLDAAATERAKIKGAIRTDFILSAEIIVIALGTVAAAPLGTRVAVLVGIALLMTVGVYGLVAGIVRLDDAGLHLAQQPGPQWWPRAQRALGRGIVRAAPWLMKTLSLAGTVAMFLVGGGILAHGLAPLHAPLQALQESAATWGGAVLAALAPLLADAAVGVAAGALLLLLVNAVSRLKRARPAGEAGAG